MPVNKLEVLESRLLELESEISQLRRLSTFRRQVGMVDFGELRGFMYVDDLGYQQTRPEQRGGDPQRVIPPPEPRDARVGYDDAGSTVLEVLFCHHWLHHLDFVVLDIGCQYGFSAISTARKIQAFGRQNQVIAFDPGVAAELVPHNILLNGMEKRVRFERLAVSDVAGPRIVFTELAHSENNRIVNQTPQQEALSYPVAAVALDEYCQFGGNLIVKIDTQGAEPEVFRGMRRLIEERLVTAISEFTPHAMATRVNPEAWLKAMAERFHLLDAGHVDLVIGPGHVLRPVAVEGFAERVDRTPSRYTDVVMIPKAMPGVEGLLERFAAGGAA